MTSSDDLHRRRDGLELSIDRLHRWMLLSTFVVVAGLFIELRDPFCEFLRTRDLILLKAQLMWRTMSAVQLARLGNALCATKGSIWIECFQGDLESQTFAWQFINLFRAAGWSAGLRTGISHYVTFGLVVPPPEGNSATLTAFVQKALTESGFDCQMTELSLWGQGTTSMPPVPEPATRLFIGPKPPLPMPV
jgi:hypothetical protein